MITYTRSPRQRLPILLVGAVLILGALVDLHNGSAIIRLVVGGMCLLSYFVTASSGVRADEQGIELKTGVGTTRFAWKDIAGFSERKVFGTRMVQVELVSGLRRSLYAPIDTRFSRDPEFDEKLRALQGALEQHR